ncbi:MAG: carbohydrate binding domain-containing protein [Pyrinomonadaceae bacterium]|nr:carbohydrate binding domain-containing protein [Pyrinomonadaceae bacterium]
MRPDLLSQRVPRVGLLLSIALACVLVFWVAANVGFSRLLGRYAAITRDLGAAQRAVSLSPSDPETHRIRAAVLHQLKGLPQAAVELELAISLRPRDDSLWLQLGMLRDELDDSSGALVALDESVRLAPHYALPRWQRGNFLLRQGRLGEGFADLRYAAASDPDYIPTLIDLSWGLSKGDQKVAEEYAQITTDQMHLAFAEFLARQGKGREAAEQFARAGAVSAQRRNELVRRLVSANAFKEAFQIWVTGKSSASGDLGANAIYDGGFEGPMSLDELGFGWHVFTGSQGIRLATDSSLRQSGSKSLLIEFLGDSNPDTPLLSQMILVKPSARYQINFAARTQEIVTGGLPLAIVTDSGSRKRLAESRPLAQKSTDWQVISFEFHTGPKTDAINLSLQRQNCTTSPCPIFGSVWLDSFSIEELR